MPIYKVRLKQLEAIEFDHIEANSKEEAKNKAIIMMQQPSIEDFQFAYEAKITVVKD